MVAPSDTLPNTISPSNITAIARNPQNVPSELTENGLQVRAADYSELITLDHAFDGLSVLNLISYASIDHEHRFKVMKKRQASN